MKVAVIGATGMVGTTMLSILEERNFLVTELVPVASDKSIGKTVQFNNKDYKICSMQEAVDANCTIALFSAGASVSLEWAPKFAEKGTFVIDNSSAWRMDANIKLIVPEINASSLTSKDKIIANPNCSTIQLLMILNPIHKRYRVKRTVISTYQSISGTGKAAIDQLNAEIAGTKADMVYPYQIFKNALPHCDDFDENDYTKEEMKLVRETQKIMDDRTIAVTATAVRIPVQGGHSESVNLELREDFQISDIRKMLQETSGVQLQDNPEMNMYPMPLYAEGKDDVFVGRIRRDFSQPKSLNLWIVADNLRKGAALNTIQIAEYLVNNKIVN